MKKTPEICRGIVISNNSSHFYRSKVLKISKFIECNLFLFNRKTCFLSNLTFLFQQILVPQSFSVYFYCIEINNLVGTNN